MQKIKMLQPVVDLTGDEMALIMWNTIKEKLLNPFIDLNLKEFDLSIQNREKTKNKITHDSADAVKKYGIGVKCATITADQGRVEEFNLSQMWKSPNGTIRNILDGTIFRSPIIIDSIPRLVKSWQKPIVIARHAFGDQYKATDTVVKSSGKLSLKFDADNKIDSFELPVHQFDSAGVALGMFNLDKSITNFAHACFNYALDAKFPVYLSTKNTILQKYDARFKDIFANVFENYYQNKFKEFDLEYRHRLIDDLAAYMLVSEGGFLWATKNYDGDVQSDTLAQGFGSLGLMTSTLLTPNGETYLTEAAHGTVTAHYRQFMQGQETSTNPIASIYAWTRALAKNGKITGNHELVDFCKKLENIIIDSVNKGYMTKDLARLVNKPTKILFMNQFIEHIAEQLVV